MKLHLKIVIFISIFFFSGIINASPYFKFSPRANEAYQKVIGLRFDEARVLIEEIKLNEPENMIIYHIENYIDFFTVFIDEEKTAFKKLEQNKNFRLSKIKSGPKSSPYYLFSQAEIKLQWALARLKFEEYFTAFNEVSQAYKLLRRNEELFPDFIANKKSMGILHAIIGTIPSNYKWGVRLLSGMDGTIDQGKNEINEVLEYSKTNSFIFKDETVVVYAFLLHYLSNESKEAWEIINSNKLDPKTNPLACFALVNLAIRTGRNDEAIEILEDRIQDDAVYPFYYLDLMLGFSKLYRLDPDADLYIKKYLKAFNGQNYIKEAFQKLAWYRLINDDIDGYQNYLDSCIAKGNAIVDNDKQAFRNAKLKKVPNPILLKARLLFDGGYYSRAEQLLEGHPLNQFNAEGERIEYIYRMARISDNLENKQKAKDYYNEAILMGKDSPLFFACNSALQMGKIYEVNNLLIHSEYYYKLCLELNPDEYKNGLHQQAKAGLNRLARLNK